MKTTKPQQGRPPIVGSIRTFFVVLALVLNLLPASSSHFAQGDVASLIGVHSASAEGGAYSIDFAAADPDDYIPPIPFPALVTPIVGRGDGDSQIYGAWFANPSTGVNTMVKSLAPDNMALGQVVPFELEITVSGDTGPENGTINFVAGWSTETTSNNDFGYDENYGVIAAFIDTSDGAFVDPGGDATVSDYTWTVIDKEIQGTFTVSGLNDGDRVVMEAWLVLDETIPDKANGNVASRLIDAWTAFDPTDAISTGNQTVPLLQVSEFFTNDVDVSVAKSDDPDPLYRGETLTYSLVVSNATLLPNGNPSSIAQNVIVTDALPPYTSFVSATVDDGLSICSESGGVVTCDLGPMVPGIPVTITITVTVNSDAPWDGTISDGTCAVGDPGVDLCNTVTVTTISDDQDETNNSDSEPTDVVQIYPPDITVTKTADPTSVNEPGGTVTFSIVVVNNSASDVTLGSLIDDVFGDLNGQGTCSVPQTLAASGGSYSCSFTAPINGDAGYVHTNIVTATASNEAGSASDTDDETVTVLDVLPTVTLTKAADPTTRAEPGGDFVFTLTIQNTSPEQVTITALADTQSGVTDFSACTALTGTTLAAGASTSCTYTVSHTEAGSYDNTASVTVADNETNTATATDNETVTVTDVWPTVTLTKSAVPTTLAEPGGDFVFTLTIYNTSIEPVDITQLTDTQSDVTDFSNCAALVGTTLEANDDADGGADETSCTYTVSHTAPGSYENTAEVVVTDNEYHSASDKDSETVTVTDVPPDITITKSASPTSVPETGGDVTFTFTVNNVGQEDVTLTSLSDSVFGDLNGQSDCATGGTIPVGGSYSCSVTVNLSADDLADHYNLVTAVGTDDDDSTDTATDDETVTFTDVAPEIQITKSASPSSVPETGGNVTFTFLVENIGEEDVTLTSLTDTVFGDLNGQGTCATGGLIPIGGSYSCSITVNLSADDLADHTNVVTAVGTDDDGTTDEATDDETVTFTDVAPDIQITKSASPSSVPETGGDVTFTFTVENIGQEDVTLTSLMDTVFGDLNGQGDCVVPQTILIGASYSCSITDFLSADDLADHTNVATAIAVDDDNTPAEDSDDETVTFDDVAPDISIVKTASPTEVPETGGDVTFTFTVNNIGQEDVTLTSLTDTEFGDLNGQGDCATGGLIPIGGSYSCSVTVNLSADDLADHTNVVTAVGTDDDGSTDTATDDETVTFTDVAPEIQITKSASPSSVPETGGDVTFTFLVENIGQEDVTLTSLTDNEFGDVTAYEGSTCVLPREILIDGSYSCSITVFLAADDLAAHTNVATATAVDDDGTEASDDDSETVTFTDVAPEIQITKTANPTHVPETGGDVTFTFTVDNIGQEDVTLTSLTDTEFDDLNGEGTCAVPQTILIGGSYECSITVWLAADSLVPHTNVATATAVDDDETQTEDSDDETVTFDDVAPDISIIKTASPTEVPETGANVTFTFVVTNDGVEAVTLTSLSDNVFGDLNGKGTCVTGGLIPIGGSYSCSITVFLAADDLAPHNNIVTAVGTDDDGTTDTATDYETVRFTDVLPDIAITKTASPTSVSELGGDVQFTIVVTNNSLEDATIDSLVDSDFDLATHCPDAVGTSLASGGTYTCVFTEHLTGDDLVAHVNTATVTASDDDGNSDTASDSATVTFDDVQPDIAITKTASPTSVSELGGDVEFTIVVTNNSLEDATIDSLVDSDFELATHCPDAVGTSLASGGTYTCVFTEYLTGDDLVTHENTATVTASDDDGNSDTASDSATVTFDDVLPDVSITKTASPTSVSELGGNVEFTIVVTNNSLEDATIDSLVDSDFDLATHCPDAVGTSLASGGTYTCVFTEHLTGDDLVAHENTATVTAADDDGNSDTASDTETVTFIDVLPDISVTKTASLDSVPETGGYVDFTFVVTNDGDEAVKLTRVFDSDFGLLYEWVEGMEEIWLATGESKTFTVDNRWIEGDYSGLDHANTVTAIAYDNDGNHDTAEDTETITFTDVQPDVSITKTADQEEVFAPGEDVEFTIVVTNNSLEDATIDELYDSVFDLAANCPDAIDTELGYGETYTCVFTELVDGDHENTVTVVASDNDSNSDTETATETVEMINPSIDIEKSTNGFDADEATGPEILSGSSVTWTYLVTNDGDVDLAGIVVSDDVLGAICTVDLAAGASTTCTATGTAAIGQYANTGTASAGYTDADDDVATRSDSDDSHYLGADPSFTVSKACDSAEPVPQESDAVFKVSFTNNGNVDLLVKADEDLTDSSGTIVAGTAFLLKAGQLRFFSTTVPGPFSGYETADNTVNATSTYTDDFLNSITVDETDSASCTVGGRVNVEKTTYYEDVLSTDYTWTFEIFAGPNANGGSDEFLSNPLATATTANGVTLLDFDYLNLDPDATYTLCENEVPAGWGVFWQVDTFPFDGVPDTTVIPWNPNQWSDPPDDLGNRCYDFQVGAGATLMFGIQNKYPGGEPRTPGYWKNWNTCTGGGQQYTAAENGGWEAGFWLLDDVLDPDVGGGIVWDDMLDDDFDFTIPSCDAAVHILDQRDGETGEKMSSDAAYTLAMHLLATQLNFAAGAGTCDAVMDAAVEAERLLDGIDFDGAGVGLSNQDKSVRKLYAQALELAAELDSYNNGGLCGGPAVSFRDPKDGYTVSGESVLLQVNVLDTFGVAGVEFYVNGDHLGSGVYADQDSWTILWPLTGLEDGSYVLMAMATNEADPPETGSADIVVIVDNEADPPAVSITSPADGAPVSGSVTITAEATSFVGEPSVVFDVNGQSITATLVDGSWSATWDSTAVGDGAYTITATADDGSNTASDSITVNVDNVPDVSIAASLEVVDSWWSKPNVSWSATANVTIAPVPDDAVITVEWGTGETMSCETNGADTCAFTLDGISKKDATVTFTVLSITASGYIYDGSDEVTIDRPLD